MPVTPAIRVLREENPELRTRQLDLTLSHPTLQNKDKRRALPAVWQHSVALCCSCSEMSGEVKGHRRGLCS